MAAMTERLDEIKRDVKSSDKVHITLSPKQILASYGNNFLDEAYEMRGKMEDLNNDLSSQLKTLSWNAKVKTLLDYVNDYYSYWGWILEKKQKIKNIHRIPWTWKYSKFNHTKIKDVLEQIESYMQSVDNQKLGRRISI